MKSLKLLLIIASVFAMMATTGCDSHGGKSKNSPKAGPESNSHSGVTVRTAHPVRRNMFEAIKATGNLEAVERMDVFSQLPGVIKKCMVEEGRPIEKNKVMAKLDDRELRLNYRQASAAYRQARVNRDNLRETVKRNEELYKEMLISQQQIEQLRAQYQVARSQVSSGRVARDLAKLNLSYATIKAPMSGEVVVRRCESNQRVTTADTIFEIAELDTMRARIYVTEKEAQRIKRGSRPVRMTFDALKGEGANREFEGKMVFVSPVVNPDSGTVEVRIEVSNPDHLLTEGMFARMTIETGLHENALAIPKQALVGEEGHYQVFIVKADPSEKGQPKAHKIDVVDGISDSEYVEILDGPIDMDTRVVIEGQNMLSEGDPVVFASPM